ncbi:MAG: hypothetical protein R2755_25320 [Acidimicrobiales bacterium]
MQQASAFSAVALLVAVAFCCCTGERWLRRRRPYDAAWTAAMACFAIGAAAFFGATAVGWNAALFRIFYLFGGVLTVPVLALGTFYLLADRRLADRIALATALLGAFAAGVVLTAPLHAPLTPDRLNEGKVIFGVLPRVFAATGSGVGATVVIVGALWSAVRLARTRRRADATGRSGLPGRRMVGANVSIALGTLLISAKGPFVALTGSDEIGFAFALAAGLVVIFAGVLLAATPVAARSPRPLAAPVPRTPVGV